MAVYPNAVKQFTNNVDQQDIVFAADMNDVQSEIQAVQIALGTVPSATSNYVLDGGRKVEYGTVKARLDAMQGNLSIPSVGMVQGWGPEQWPNRAWKQYNGYVTDRDEFKYGKGYGFLTKDAGWWLLFLSAIWDFNATGYRTIQLYASGSSIDAELSRDQRLAAATLGTTINQQSSYFGFIPAGTQIRTNIYQNSGGLLNLNNITLNAILLKRDASYYPSTPTPFPR